MFTLRGLNTRFYDGIVIEYCASLFMQWDIEFDPLGLNPKLLYSQQLERHMANGVFHQNDPTKPAITASNLIVRWFGNDKCVYSNIPYRSGPLEMQLFNYREYWYEGNFIRAEWDDIIYQWKRNEMDDEFFTYGSKNIIDRPPPRPKNNWTQTILSIFENPQKPFSPLNNKFFNSDTDEMMFLNCEYN